jgi:hypothetical protein
MQPFGHVEIFQPPPPIPTELLPCACVPRVVVQLRCRSLCVPAVCAAVRSLTGATRGASANRCHSEGKYKYEAVPEAIGELFVTKGVAIAEDSTIERLMSCKPHHRELDEMDAALE